MEKQVVLNLSKDIGREDLKSKQTGSIEKIHKRFHISTSSISSNFLPTFLTKKNNSSNFINCQILKHCLRFVVDECQRYSPLVEGGRGVF